jgi:3-hydroxymyristoyl/3-hydroxydecanoyl-(acyl carrier protein) dehydratase
VFAADVRVPDDYVYFEGHFDGYPILAGVVQLHELLLPLVQRVRADLGPLRELTQLKFLGRILPGDALEVTLRFAADQPDCRFQIVRGDETCSAGRLRFGPTEAS